MTMFLSGISASSAGGSKTVSQLTDFFVHALRRGGGSATATDDGMLWYTKVRSTDSAETADFHIRITQQININSTDLILEI